MNSTDTSRETLAELGRESDRIVNLILHTGLPRVDVEIQIENFREEVLRLYPDGDRLFDMIYAARFDRIWKQWESERPHVDEFHRAAWGE